VDLRRLDYFIHIAETESLTKAAVQLQVSHSMLSRGIQEFETELGHRLFHRTGRGMKLTEYGKQLLPRAQQVAMEVSRFSDEATALRGNLAGTVSVGLPGSIAARIAAPVFLAARKQHPALSVRFVEALSGGVEELLAARRIDIGLFYAAKANPGRGDVALARSNLCLVGPAGDRVTAKGTVRLSQVAQCPLVLPSRPHAVRVMVEEACARADLDIYVPCEIDSLLALKEVVASGAGYTIAAHDAVAREVAAGRLQAALIKDPPLARLLVMTVGPKHSLTTATRAIAGLISSMAAELIKEGHWRAPGSKD
jgi:LysR family nitrogen assimilation transcriptional regulator